MKAVDEIIDEELGEKVVSFREDDENIEDNDNGGGNDGTLINRGPSSPSSSPISNSAPIVGWHRDLLSRFRGRSDNGAHHDHLRDSERSSSSAAGKWKSMGSRRIRFASVRSDVNNDELRGIVATPLDSGQCKPMGAGERFLTNIQTELGDAARPELFRRMASYPLDQKDEDQKDEGSNGFAESNNPNRMFRLQATRGARDVGCFRRTLRFFNACINCGALTESATEQNLYLGFGNPNRWLIDFFFWLFRKGWSTVLMLSVVWFYVLVLFFALLIVWASDIDNDCVRVGGKRFGELDNRSLFSDAFSLSWNTFSTVGYGSTYPALSIESDKTGGDSSCAFIALITSIEAFVGVLYAGFTGAIIFAKVTRITQRADIRFSDPLTVRFGAGVDDQLVDDDEDKPQDEGETKKGKGNKTPLQEFRNIAKKVAKPSSFPVITFRIANENHDTLGGEIISVTVNAVVLIESTKYDDQVSEDLAKEIDMHRTRRASTVAPGAKLRKSASKRFNAGDTEKSERSSDGMSVRTGDTMSEEDGTSSSESSKNVINYLAGLNALARNPLGKKMKIDEEEGSGTKIVPRMVFTKLKLETSEHPLFKRIWRFKHIIDQDSPLLTAEAQRAIMNNNGKWPWEWNNHKAVRKAIRFNQMVVSFTGISNISGASVYKQRVYDYIDTVVGYQFVNALYRGRRGNLKVDLRLVNDVMEQNGGGGEPLHISGKDRI